MKWTIDIETVIINSIKSSLKEVKLSRLEETEMIPVPLAVGNVPTQNHEADCKEMEVITPATSFDGTYADETFDQNIEGNECRISILKCIDQKATLQKHVLKSVIAKFLFFKLGFVAICLESNIVKVYSLFEYSFVYQFEAPATDVPISLLSWQNDTFSFLLWSKNRSQVICQNRRKFLHLTEQPKLVSDFVDVWAFAHTGDTITIWEEKENVRLDITNVQHGLSVIDKLKLTNDKTLFLFDYRLNVMVKFHFDVSSETSVSCSLQTVFKLSSLAEIPLKFVTVMGKTIVAESESDEWYSAELPI